MLGTTLYAMFKKRLNTTQKLIVQLNKSSYLRLFLNSAIPLKITEFFKIR